MKSSAASSGALFLPSGVILRYLVILLFIEHSARRMYVTKQGSRKRLASGVIRVVNKQAIYKFITQLGVKRPP